MSTPGGIVAEVGPGTCVCDCGTAGVLAKEAFWRHLKHQSIEVSERQRKIIHQLLDGFEGKLTTEKWAKQVKVSHDTALRDIQDLIKKSILRQEEGGGRSTAYTLLHEETGKR